VSGYLTYCIWIKKEHKPGLTLIWCPVSARDILFIEREDSC